MFLDWLLDTSMGVPGPDGHWPPWLTMAFHGSNLVIALTHLAIPAIVIHGWQFRRDGVSPWAFYGVIGFLVAMAMSRLGRVLEVNGPPYHLTAILDGVAAAASVYSTFALVPLVRTVLSLPSRNEIHALNGQLHVEVLEKELRRLEAVERERETAASNAALQGELAGLKSRLLDRLWYTDRAAMLADIERITRLIPHDDGTTTGGA